MKYEVSIHGEWNIIEVPSLRRRIVVRDRKMVQVSKDYVSIMVFVQDDQTKEYSPSIEQHKIDDCVFYIDSTMRME